MKVLWLFIERRRFLKELLRHLICLNGFVECCASSHVNSYDECVDIEKPEDFNVPFGVADLATYKNPNLHFVSNV